MLFSKDFSDVQFHCPGGAVLYAHQVILSAASDYFKTVFKGPWADEHPNGIWQTTNSAELMKIMLTFIYTGDQFQNKCPEQHLDIVSLAHEYQLTDLLQISAKILIDKIDEENVKEILQASALYNLDDLKKSCFLYIKEDFAMVLMDGNFMKLAEKDESLWSELRLFLSQK